VCDCPLYFAPLSHSECEYTYCTTILDSAGMIAA
jgi:hypothetical protein